MPPAAVTISDTAWMAAAATSQSLQQLASHTEKTLASYTFAIFQ